MKNLRYLFVLLAMLGLASLALSTGCGSAAPIPPAEVPAPIGVSMLDGGNNIPVDSSFKYTFSQDVLTQTVDTSTFFIVKNEAQASLAKADLDTSICDPSRAIDAVVTCSSNTECSLVPTVNLDYASSYTICLTTDIRYFDGSPFEGIMATFTTEVDGPLSLNDLDGATGVPIASEFRYRFQQEVESATADDSTFFIVSLGASASLNKADVIPSICVAANALDAEISCTDWSCTLSPVDVLEYGTSYAACLTGDIDYQPVTQTVGQLQIQSQAEFDGFMASFGTEEAPITPTEVTITDAKLVRLDGTELELEHRPIPRAINIKYVLSAALPTEEERLQFESAVTLVDELAATVDGSYEWAGDFLSVVFTPTWPLEYRTEYTIVVDTGSLPLVSLNKANGEDMSFTTMTYRDINGDGFADVAVGAWSYISGSNVGSAYIFTGSAEGVPTCDLSNGCTAQTTFTGTADLGEPFWLGSAPDIIGDVNADGFADAIVDASGADAGGVDRGEVYIFLGSTEGIGNCSFATNPPGQPDVTIRGEDDYDYFGWVAAKDAGDVNGDGYDDVVIGASYANAGGTYRGKSYIFLGGEGFLGELSAGDANAIIVGGNDGDSLGAAVSGAGDVNDDGFDDVIVGAPWVDGGGSDRGATYVFLGAEEGIPDCDLSMGCTTPAAILGAVDNSAFGAALSNAGDMNGDGYDDILIGAPSASTNGKIFNGAAYIIGGSPTGIADCDLSGECTPLASVDGDNDSDGLGFCLSAANDVDDDGYGDALIGVKKYEGTRGRSYVFVGKSGFSGVLTTADATASMTGAVGDYFSYNCGDAGDVDGDGYDDLIIGAPYVSTGATHNGRAYIFEGGPQLIGDFPSNDAQTILTGENDLDRFGAVY